MAHSGSAYRERIETFAARARRDQDRFDLPAELPAEERAMTYLREGLGPLTALYIEARTAEWDVEFSAAELEKLHRATNDWLSLYARCYGYDLDTDVTIRKVAEVLLETHNIRDTAQLLTHVPPKEHGATTERT